MPSWEAKLGKAVRRLWGLRDGKDWIILNSKPTAFDATVRLYEKKDKKTSSYSLTRCGKGQQPVMFTVMSIPQEAGGCGEELMI